MLTYPVIDPVAFSLGVINIPAFSIGWWHTNGLSIPVNIKWYALAYLAGFMLGWAYCVHWAKKNRFRPNREDFDDFIPYVILGTILGGRFGYVLFYQFEQFAANPADIFKVWNGGMSFHGGLLGVVISVILFSKLRKIPTLAMGDLCCACAPIGLFLGRIANFVNDELWGRVTDGSLGMVFPRAVDPLYEVFSDLYLYNPPRHPSQLYQAGLEGILLFLMLYLLVRRADIRARHGLVMGVFLVGYAIMRTIGEIFREPDSFMGYYGGVFTMGQILSLPVLIAGIILIVRALKREPALPANVIA